jgi:surface antigen
LITAAAGANTGWIIAATVLGAVAGGVVADYLTQEDETMAGDTMFNALETQPTGEESTWRNPDSGNSGSVTVDETYERADGTPCRRFTQTVTAGGQTESGVGSACRAPDGTWQIQS